VCAVLAVCGLGVLLTGSTMALAAPDRPPLELAGPAPATDETKGAPPEDPSGKLPADTSGVPVRRPLAPLGQGYAVEVEPNGTSGTATPLVGSNLVVRATIYPNADVDWYSFTAAAGDRVYAAMMTNFSANASSDSQLRLYQPDGTTLIEFDDDDGVLGGLSSSIADATIPGAGTYFLEVRHFSASNQLRPYELHLRLQSGAPTPEVESNDTPATANPLPAGGWVSGARNPAVATEQDWYSFTASAGDTVFLSLDLDPERDTVQWNGRLGIALFGDASNQILVVDDASAGSAANPLSEAMFMTIKTAGTYFAFVDSASAATGGPTATYTLSVSIHPAADEGVNCTTYTSTNVPQTIGPGAGLVSSTITVPGNPRIADLDVEIQLNHALMGDVDAHLRSPAGNDNGLFTDIGAAAVGGQTQMDVVFDDEAGITPAFTVLRGLQVKPELGYRLSWFDGEDAGGTWTLDLRDDGANASGGTLTGWSIRICEPVTPPTCSAGFATTTVFSTDFEAGDAGFTHSGTGDEWERGLPAFAPITTCSSGASCFKTDLDNTYNASNTQDLLSAAIDLTGLSGPVVATWAQRYQIENASFDHAFVDAQLVGGTNSTRLFEWLDATMTDTVGNPTVTLNESSGWSLRRADVSSYAGQSTFQLRFHLDGDSSVQLAGLAIDDVTVTACRPLAADVAITKTDGVATAVPGSPVTYTITASNAGPDPVTGGTVADTFPAACAAVSWTCAGAGGGTCTAGPVAGNIADTVNLPAGGSVTYTATCTISPAATGTLANTATVSAGAMPDPSPANNSATDTDTLVPQADLAITKNDGVASVIPGNAVTYAIVASNPGPSDASGTAVADTFPAACATVSWTCVGSGGGTCTAGPVAGNIADTASLPAGGSVTYSATCTVDPAATGTLDNTATVTGTGVTDPNGANNAATDSDVITQGPYLSATKQVSGTVFVTGSAVTYTIVVTNTGGTTQADNPGDELVDVLPAQLQLVSATATSGTVVATVATRTVTWNGSLAPAATVTVTINATLLPVAPGVTVSNQGTVSFDADANGTNESTGVTDDPTVGGSSDPTEFQSQGNQEIPTLSTLGLLALMAALAFAAVTVLRRSTGMTAAP
jgi:uncharacterized repeat protein (TIGR01451 family)